MSYNSGNCSPPTSMPAASWLHQPKAQTPSGRRGTHLAGWQELWISVTHPHVGTVTIKLEQRQKRLSLKCSWRETGLVSQGGQGMVLRERGCEGCRSRHWRPGCQRPLFCSVAPGSSGQDHQSHRGQRRAGPSAVGTLPSDTAGCLAGP